MRKPFSLTVMPLLRRMAEWIIAFIVLFAVLLVAAYVYQDQLIFHPWRGDAGGLETEANRAGLIPWRDARGTRIGWQSKAGDPREVIVLFHGNAGAALHRADYPSFLHGNSRKFYVLEYPGYADRSGRPGEKPMTEAAVQALDGLALGGAQSIWVLGESIGTGVACGAVRGRPKLVQALVLITPFDSLVHAAQVHYPMLPVSLLIRHRFNSVENLKDYPGPVAFLLAEDDRTVPAQLGRALYEAYPGVKRLWVTAQADHNDTPLMLSAWPEIAAWLKESGAK
ncbi:hypothetical protein TSACC_21848 [Terrimicrobium sacchariphilum]|uniref:AB hydrolase-1 domain-containing protein n=1 Tax=Terrimicrobium sacchariphilum TaxID=690879 RepID=A0A146G7W4_TERSA|nr:alpha/beta hydrolase [Terrimicrobium sacchariphilum]GAT33432.1 hypothetical protein TSACC_21848 [Terrimicrobium sacchariphilum]